MSFFALDGTKLVTVPLEPVAIAEGVDAVGTVEATGAAVRYEIYDDSGYWVAGGTIGSAPHDEMNLADRNLTPTEVVDIKLTVEKGHHR